MSVIPVIAQLTYASTDGGSGPGGWQVIQHRGHLSEARLDTLARRMPTTISATVPIPDYRVPGLPTRMATGPLPDSEDTVVWHSVPAGRDGTGRPGNVFTHCAVFAPGDTQLTALWRSPSWLTPFGAREVRAADLGDAAGLSTVDWLPGLAEFLFASSRWGVGTLGLIADAASAAVRGGPVVVLEIDTCDEGAAWLIALTHCTDARSARRINFSTWERTENASRWASDGLHIVCVPRDDHTQLAQLPNCVVVDTAVIPSLGEWGGHPHMTERGDPVPVTPWSVTLMDRCSTPDDFFATVRGIESLRTDFPDSDWELAWPMAFLAFAAGRDTTAEAAAVLTAGTPDEVGRNANRLPVIISALDTKMGDGTDNKWLGVRELITSGASPFVVNMAVDVFMRRVTADLPWLTKQPVPPTFGIDRPVPMSTAAEKSFFDATDDLTSRPIWNTDDAYASLCMADLAAQLGWTDVPSIANAVHSAFERLPDILATGDSRIINALHDMTDQTQQLARQAFVEADVPPPDASLIQALRLDTPQFLSSPFIWLSDGVLRPAAGATAELVLNNDSYPLELRSHARHLLLVDSLSLPFAPYGIVDEPNASTTDVPLTPVQVSDLIRRFGASLPENVLSRGLIDCAGDADYARLAEQVVNARHSLSRFAEAISWLTDRNPLQYGLDHLAQAVADIRQAGISPSRMKLPDAALQVGHLVATASILLDLPFPKKPFAAPIPFAFAPARISQVADAILPYLGSDQRALGADIACWIALYAPDAPFAAQTGTAWISRLGCSSPSQNGMFKQLLSRLATTGEARLDAEQISAGINKADQLTPTVEHDPNRSFNFVVSWAIEAGILSRTQWVRAKIGRGRMKDRSDDDKAAEKRMNND